jgi:hypothetical protein
MSQGFFFLLLGMGVFGLLANHWPWNSRLGLYFSIAGFAIWYFWRFFVTPFRAGLNSDNSGRGGS